MARVASLKAAKRRKNEVDVALDDGTTLRVLVDVVAAAGLAKGIELDAEAQARLLEQDALERCRQGAWRLIGVAPRTRQGLRAALLQRRHRAALVDRVVDAIAASGHLDERDFARNAVELESHRRGRGPRMVEARLRASGVSAEAAREATAPLKEAAAQRARAAEALAQWARRRHDADPRKRLRSAVEFLARRGFDAEVAWEAARAIVGGADDEPGPME